MCMNMEIISQEIVRHTFLEHLVSFSWGWVVLDVGLLEGLIHVHDGGLVSAAVAVVGCGEDGGDVFVVGAGIALNHRRSTSIMS